MQSPAGREYRTQNRTAPTERGERTRLPFTRAPFRLEVAGAQGQLGSNPASRLTKL